MTFTEGVLRLVRIRARIDRAADAAASARADVSEIVAAEPDALEPEVVDLDDTLAAELLPQDDLPADATEPSPLEPGFAELEAAVALVEAGLATRVVLAGFRPWPGLLWQARQLAEEAGVQILPTVVRPGGRVDIEITRHAAADG